MTMMNTLTPPKNTSSNHKRKEKKMQINTREVKSTVAQREHNLNVIGSSSMGCPRSSQRFLHLQGCNSNTVLQHVGRIFIFFLLKLLLDLPLLFLSIITMIKPSYLHALSPNLFQFENYYS